MAGHGEAWLDMGGTSAAGKVLMVRFGMAGQGTVSRGLSRHGRAGQGSPRADICKEVHMGWSKEEKTRIRTEMMAEMRTAARYSVQDFRNKYLPTTPSEERDFNLLHWEAQELMRVDEGIDFGPMRKWPGVYERKDWRQTEQRAVKQRAKGTRAHKRAEQKMRLAASLAPDTSKERVSEAADRMALRIAMRPKVTIEHTPKRAKEIADDIRKE